MATQPLEDVAESGQAGPLQLFQLYVIKDRSFCKRLIQRKYITYVHRRSGVVHDAVVVIHDSPS